MKLETKNLSLITALLKKTDIIAIVLILLMFIFEFSSSITESQIIDEGAHLAAGYSYLINYKIELNPEHPPLLKLLAAISIWPTSPTFPWKELTDANQWDIAGKFFYDIGNNADLMLFFGRIPTMIMSLLLGWLIYKWTQKIAGNKAALLALLLFVFDPNILAHSRYITTDIPVSLGFFATLYYFCQYFKTPNRKQLIIFSIIFACTQMLKFSALLLWPLLLFLVLILITKLKLKQWMKLILGAIIATLLIIPILYFGHYQPYITGIDELFKHEKGGHLTYLLGNIDEQGFWYYFPIVFLVKTPLSLIILLIFSIPVFIYYWRRQIPFGFINFFRKIPIDIKIVIIFPIFYFIVTMVQRINLGIRHLLPIYPFLIIFMVYSLSLLKKKYMNWLVAFLILVLISESLFIYPNYLTYFSVLIGGNTEGYKYLLDSNLDWGQDLKKLKKYLTENNIEDKINLLYFGKASPNYYKINYQPLNENITHGWIAISAQYLFWYDSKYLWLLNYSPVQKIGNSIYLYYIQK